MIPFINIIFLQTTPLQNFLNWVFPSTENGTFTLLPSYSQLAVVILVVGLLFLGLRIYKNYRKFAIPENRLETYDFLVQGYFQFRANMSRDDEPLLDTTLHELETIDEIKEGIENLRQWATDEKLYIYQGIYTDLENAVHLRGEGSRFTMISTVDIANDDYYWVSKKGRFDWGTLRKEHNRQIVCLEPSMKRDGITIDGNEKDVWFVYPAMRSKIGEHNVFQSQIEELSPNKIEINISVLDPKQTQKIAAIFDWLMPLKKLQAILNTVDRTDRLTQKMVKKAYNLVAQERIDGDMARGIAAREPVYKIEIAPKVPIVDQPILWMALTLFGAYIGSHLPSIIDQLKNTDPSLLALLGGGIVIGCYFIFGSRKKDKEKEDMQKIEDSESIRK